MLSNDLTARLAAAMQTLGVAAGMDAIPALLVERMEALAASAQARPYSPDLSALQSEAAMLGLLLHLMQDLPAAIDASVAAALTALPALAPPQIGAASVAGAGA